MSRAADRFVFIDDGGDGASNLLFSAVCVTGPVLDLEKQADELIRRFTEIVGLPSSTELHAAELIRDPRLETFQSEFLIQQALQFLASAEGITVMTTFWNWHPEPYRHPGHGKAHRHRALYRDLISWLDREAERSDYEIAEITIDGGTNARHLTREHEEWARTTKSRRILVPPRFDRSAGIRLLQLADATAYSAFLSCRPATTSSHRVPGGRRRRRATAAAAGAAAGASAAQDPATLWYPQRLKGCFPESVALSGVRNYAG